jgi:hypothetical protein
MGFFRTASKVQCADRGSYVLGAQIADSAVLTIQCMPSICFSHNKEPR